jgi:hypothetical protein
VTTIVRYLTFMIVVTGCTFASPFAEEPEPEPIEPGPMPVAQPCRTDEPGVVLCVDFEDPSLAAQAIDRSPHQNHAIAHDVESTLRLPPDERAAVLSTVSSLRVPESPSLDLAAFTIEMWIYPELRPGKGQDVGLFDNHNQYSMRLRDGLRIRCGLDLISKASASSRGSVLERTWSHVACRYAEGQMRVYINGHLSACQALTPIPLGSTLGSAIGAEIDPLAPENLRDRFIGGVDNVRIYDRALEDARICAAAGQAPGTCQSTCPGKDD